MRVFLDTNVLISAFITRGLCSDIFKIILAEHHLVLSEYILSELDRILTEKINLPQEQIHNIITFLHSFEIVKDQPIPIKLDLRDEKDIPVLAAAINSNSEVLVTGDKDLLKFKGQNAIEIVDPGRFLQIVKG